MRKRLIFMLSFALSFAMLGCNPSVVVGNFHIGDYAFAGFVSITIDNSNYEIDEPVPVLFEYGHFYLESGDYANIAYHSFEVLVEDISHSPLSEDPLFFTSLDYFEIDNFTTDEYRCTKSIFSKTLFPKSFELEIDFTQFDFNAGVLIFRIGVLSYGDSDEETFGFQQEMIYFTITDNQIKFSKTNPN